MSVPSVWPVEMRENAERIEIIAIFCMLILLS